MGRVANCSGYKTFDICRLKRYKNNSTAAAPLHSKRNSVAFSFGALLSNQNNTCRASAAQYAHPGGLLLRGLQYGIY